MAVDATSKTSAAIMLTEPDAQLREAIHAGLETAGHAVFDTGAEDVVRVANQRPPDVVLLDVQTEGSQCWEVLAQLTGNETTADIPVVLITENDDDEDARMGVQRGAFDFVARPIRNAALNARVSAAIRAKRLTDTLQRERRQANTDNSIDRVTGVLTHQRTMELLEHFTSTAKRYNHDLSVVRFDLDHFTKINDVYGTHAADEVLKSMADHLKDDLRSSDVAGRWGEDEFIVLLPHTDVRGALVFAERFRLTVAESPTHLSDGVPVAVSASFGCADGSDLEDLVRTSGAMLREAKRKGRNAVCHRPKGNA